MEYDTENVDWFAVAKELWETYAPPIGDNTIWSLVTKHRKTPEKWWKLLTTAPKVGGPWTRKYGENHRVDTILVRRLPNGEEFVRVYGPVKRPVDDSDSWIVNFQGSFWWIGPLPSKASLQEALQAADEKLRDHRFLLCGGDP